MRPSRTPIKRLAPKSRYVEPMNLDFLKYYDMICIFALYDLFLVFLFVATFLCFHASYIMGILASYFIQKKKERKKDIIHIMHGIHIIFMTLREDSSSISRARDHWEG